MRHAITRKDTDQRIRLFQQTIYPELARHKLMNDSDYQAVPTILNLRDRFATDVWKRINQAYRYALTRSQKNEQ